MDHTTFTETLGDEKQINLWNTALIKSKAVIAGGGVLAPYAGYVRKDLDIYVGKENLVTLCNNLLPLGLKTSHEFDGLSTIHLASKDKLCFCSGYDKSFFRKNNLLARLGVRVKKHIQVGTILEKYDPRVHQNPALLGPDLFYCEESNKFRSTYRVSKIDEIPGKEVEVTLKGVPIKYFHSEYTPEDRTVPMRELVRQDVDIIVVDTEKTTIEEVVSNFDLSFCEIWYDGSGIKLGKTNPEEILQKKGFLQGEYVQSLVNGNAFIKSRLGKYKGRGFSIGMKPDKDISYECSSMTKVSEENLDTWASYFTYTYLLMSTSILITMGTPSIYPEERETIFNYNMEILPLLELMSVSASPGSYPIVKFQTVSTCLATLIAQPRWKKNKDGDCDSEGGCIVELIRRYAPEAMKPLSEDMSRKDQISAIAKILQDKYSEHGDGYDFLSFYHLRCFRVYLQTFFGTAPKKSEEWTPGIYYRMLRSMETTPSREYHNADLGRSQGIVNLPTWVDILWETNEPLNVDWVWYYMNLRPDACNVITALDLLGKTVARITKRDVSQVRLWKIKGEIWKLHKEEELQSLNQYHAETELNTKDGPPFLADLLGIEESEEKQDQSDVTKRIQEISAQLLTAQRERNISELRRLMKERNDLQQAQKPVVDSGPKGLTIDRYNDQAILEGDDVRFGFFTLITDGPGGQYQAWGSSVGTLFGIITPHSYKGGVYQYEQGLYQEFKARITRPQTFDQKDNQAECIKLFEQLTNNTVPNLDKVLVTCRGDSNKVYPSYDQMVDGYNAFWYAKIDTGPTYRSAIPYNSLKAIIKSYIRGYRVFKLSGETNIEEVSTIGNLKVGPDDIDLSNSAINTFSGTHCNNVGHVYTDVTIFMQPNGEPPSFHPLGSNTIVPSRDTRFDDDLFNDTEESKEGTNNLEAKSADKNVAIGRARGRARAARLRSAAVEEEDVSARVARLRSDLDAAAEEESLDRNVTTGGARGRARAARLMSAAAEEESLDRNVTTGGARGRARAARLRSAAEEGDVVDEYRSGGESLAEGASIDEENGLDNSAYDNEEALMNAAYFGAGAGGENSDSESMYGGYIPPHLRRAPSDSDSESMYGGYIPPGVPSDSDSESMYGGYIPPRVPSIDYEEEDHN